MIRVQRSVYYTAADKLGKVKIIPRLNISRGMYIVPNGSIKTRLLSSVSIKNTIKYNYSVQYGAIRVMRQTYILKSEHVKTRVYVHAKNWLGVILLVYTIRECFTLIFRLKNTKWCRENMIGIHFCVETTFFRVLWLTDNISSALMILADSVNCFFFQLS